MSALHCTDRSGCLATLALIACCAGLGACDHATMNQTAEPVAPPPAVADASHVAAGALVPPGGTLTNPHQGDKAVAKSGAQMFTAMNCDGCHGPDASGAVGPNLGDGRWRYGGSDAEVFQSIYYGRPKGMPAFGGALGANGVWVLVTYLRSLTPPPNIPTESWE
jgi:cytochrome c oxidase cbb3-type subunit III